MALASGHSWGNQGGTGPCPPPPRTHGPGLASQGPRPPAGLVRGGLAFSAAEPTRTAAWGDGPRAGHTPGLHLSPCCRQPRSACCWLRPRPGQGSVGPTPQARGHLSPLQASSAATPRARGTQNGHSTDHLQPESHKSPPNQPGSRNTPRPRAAGPGTLGPASRHSPEEGAPSPASPAGPPHVRSSYRRARPHQCPIVTGGSWPGLPLRERALSPFPAADESSRGWGRDTGRPLIKAAAPGTHTGPLPSQAPRQEAHRAQPGPPHHRSLADTGGGQSNGVPQGDGTRGPAQTSPPPATQGGTCGRPAQAIGIPVTAAV